MTELETLNKLCYDERGAVKTKADCRAAMINHLILDELVDIDDAEDTVEKAIREFNLWPEDQKTEAKPQQ